MFPRDFYEILHIIGIAFVFAAIGGVAIHAANGGDRAASQTRKLVTAVHGTGMLLILVGGFGMLARIGFAHGTNFPGWLWAKLAIWLVFGGVALLPYRKPALARPALLVLPLLAGLAAYMALYKPI
ncbi:MAG: hypothetical protein LCH84_17680 [Gemmatimonadetes bacterium]|nr:hypothetical protein [Gemmatimonadota bacterium]